MFNKTIGETSDAAQRGARWFEERIGCLTASKLNAMLDIRKDTKDGAKRKSLKYAILAERMTNVVADSEYVNPAMQWGIDMEDSAIDLYEDRTGRETKEASFFKHPEIDYLGASPDRLIGDDGLLEVKCPTTPTHLKYLQSTECPQDYWPQMALQLECTGRHWCDFVSFDPRMTVDKHKIRVWRFVPETGYTEWLLQECNKFLAEVEQMFDALDDTGA